VKPRIYADFNYQDEGGRPWLNCVGSKESIIRNNVTLEQGLQVVLYEDDFEVEAVLSFDEKRKVWLGIPNWDTIHYFETGRKD
jgi:hypothetical protein